MGGGRMLWWLTVANLESVIVRYVIGRSESEEEESEDLEGESGVGSLGRSGVWS